MVNLTEAEKIYDDVANQMRRFSTGHIFVKEGMYLALEERYLAFFEELKDYRDVNVSSGVVNFVDIVWLPKSRPAEAAMERENSFVTALGCVITVDESPDHMGKGSLLLLRVDSRRSEVYLSPDDKEQLRRLLEAA